MSDETTTNGITSSSSSSANTTKATPTTTTKNEEDDLVDRVQELKIKQDGRACDDDNKDENIHKGVEDKTDPSSSSSSSSPTPTTTTSSPSVATAVVVPLLSPEIQQVADWIRSSKRIMVLCGAGVSVAAGIPDFRTPGTGLYDNLQSYNLPYPEAVFELDFYRSNPRPFLRLAQEIWPGMTHSPTRTHTFLSLLAQKQQQLLRIYSQNIDGLEFLAGIPANEIVECHGHFRSISCIECHTAVKDVDRYRDMIVHPTKSIKDDNNNNNNDKNIPRCEQCGGLVKPDIVFFGESLPDRFHRLLQTDVARADLLLVMGTSLQVAPVSMIPDFVRCKRVLINREQVGNFHFGKTKTTRDIFLQGNSDDTIEQLAQALGWQEELEELFRQTKVQRKDSEQK